MTCFKESILEGESFEAFVQLTISMTLSSSRDPFNFSFLGLIWFASEDNLLAETFLDPEGMKAETFVIFFFDF